MATIVKLKSGNYRVQIRRKGQYASKTFSNKSDALSWLFEADRRSDQGRGIIAPKINFSKNYWVQYIRTTDRTTHR